MFVNKKIADDFYKALKLFMDFEIDGNAYDPGTLYKDWLSGAVYALKMREYYNEQNKNDNK